MQYTSAQALRLYMVHGWRYEETGHGSQTVEPASDSGQHTLRVSAEQCVRAWVIRTVLICDASVFLFVL